MYKKSKHKFQNAKMLLVSSVFYKKKLKQFFENRLFETLIKFCQNFIKTINKTKCFIVPSLLKYIFIFEI